MVAPGSGSLSNAQVLAAVAVEIGADLSKLRAGANEARSIAASAERTTRISLPILVAQDAGAKVRADTARIATQATAAAPPVRIPVQLDTTQLRAQVMQVQALARTAAGGFGGGNVIVPGGTVGRATPPPLPIGGPSYIPMPPVGLLPKPPGGNDDGPDRLGRSAQRAQRPLRNLEDAIEGLGGAAGQAGVKLLVGRQIAAMVAGTLNMGAASAEGFAALRAGDYPRSDAVKAGVRNQITSVDNRFFGGLGQSIDRFQQSVFGGSLGDLAILAQRAVLPSRVQRAFGGGPQTTAEVSATDKAIAEQEKQTNRLTAQAERLAAINEGAKAVTEAARGDFVVGRPSQLAAIEARRELRKFEEQNIGVKSADVDDARRALRERAERAEAADRRVLGAEGRDRAINTMAANVQNIIVENAGMGERAAMRGRQRAIAKEDSGDADGAFAENRFAERTALFAGLEARTGELQVQLDLLKAQKAELPEIAKAQTALDQYRDTARARLALFDAETQSQTEDRRVRKAAAAYGTIGNIQATNLRLQKRHYEAELKEFDTALQRRIMLEKDAAEKQRIAAEGAAQRRLIVQQQAEQVRSDRIGLSTRRQVAGAQGEGMGQLAGVLASIGGMRQEALAAPANLRADVLRTQAAELRSMESGLLRPRGYAREFDPTTDVAGGPDGQAGKEQTEILKAIRDYLAQIAQNGQSKTGAAPLTLSPTP